MISRFLFTSLLLRLALASKLSVSTTNYIKSHDNDLYVWPLLDTVVVRSTSHCATVCSRNDRCHMFNVCPRKGSLEQVDCSLFGDSSLQAGISLKNDTEKGCFQMVRPEVASKASTTPPVGTTEPLRCENGGTLENGKCRCTIQYGGTTCQRLIRDCTEPYENGYTNSSAVSLRIQPAGTSAPFWIVCLLDHGGLGYPLIRSNNIVSFNVNWTTMKSWIGNVSSAKTLLNSHYFIGLENLHHLLSQADYYGNVYCEYDNWEHKGHIYYNNFTVGPENSSYALSYQPTFLTGNAIDDGFNGPLPNAFSTNDHDPQFCKKGYPGWFGSTCTGYSVFADTLTWPVTRIAKNVVYLNIGVSRRSNFYF